MKVSVEWLKKYVDFNVNCDELVNTLPMLGLEVEELSNESEKNLNNVVLQGGLDPKILLSSEQEIINNAKKYLNIFNGLPYVFNLGHGLLPETDPDKVDRLVKFYRKY